MDEFLLPLSLVILFAPLLAAVFLVFFGRRLGRHSDTVALGAMGVSLAAALLVFRRVALETWDGPAEEFWWHVEWFRVGAVDLHLGLLVDRIASAMSVVVTLLMFLVFLYSKWYMHGDRSYPRYYAFFSFFGFSMLGIVLADSLFLSFVFWELVGLGSYLLIGFWYDKPAKAHPGLLGALKLSPAHACTKAFIMNRVGDFGFLVGMAVFFLVMTQAGERAGRPDLLEHALSWNNIAQVASSDVLAEQADVGREVVDAQGFVRRVEAPVGFSLFGTWFSGYALLTFAGIAVFMGAVGKSAQFPLHSWLPDAMQGPTTGSSIIHAATMVAAGVYLVARMHPVLTQDALLFIAVIGGITAFLAATMALVQWDIKAVLAYSTISQLGYMMIGLGSGVDAQSAGGYQAGLLHLLTHAFFKCMLFLCAGAVIHACAGEQNMWKMGGLRKKMPVVFACTVLGTLAISGVPFFTGFFSKDLILVNALATAKVHGGGFWLPAVLGIVTAALTAFYMFRLVFLTFTGKPRDESVTGHAHDPWRVAAFPMLVMAAFTFAPAWTSVPWLEEVRAASESVEAQPAPAVRQLAPPQRGFFAPGAAHGRSPEAWADPAVGSARGGEPAEAVAHAHHEAHGLLSWLSLVMVALAVVVCWLIYGRQPRKVQRFVETPGVQQAYAVLTNLWFVDLVYDRGVVRVSHGVMRAAAFLDMRLLDGVLVDMWSWMVRLGAMMARLSDDFIVDRLVDLCGHVWRGGGRVLRHLQDGKVQTYLAFGVVILSILMLVALARTPF